MRPSLTSLGVSPGLDRASFVFGGSSNANGVTLSMAINLSQPESIAHQHMDFIQKLYSEQRYPGQSFEQIDIGAMVSRDSSQSATRAQQSIVLLRELLANWIAQDSLELTIRSHSSVEILTQKKLLYYHDPASGILEADSNRINDAFALWSLAFPQADALRQSEVLTLLPAVSFEEFCQHIPEQFLSRYMQSVLASVSATEYADEQAERQRRYLLQMANRPDSSKLDLLLGREQLLEVLEAYPLVAEADSTPMTDTANGLSVERKAVASTGRACTHVLDLVLERERPVPLPLPVEQEMAADIALSAPAVRQQGSWREELSRPVGGYSASPDSGDVDQQTSPEPLRRIWREPTASERRMQDWLFRVVLTLVLLSFAIIIGVAGD